MAATPAGEASAGQITRQADERCEKNRSRNPGYGDGVLRDDRPGRAQSIHRGGHDPAGVAGPLADRVQARNAGRLAADRSRGRSAPANCRAPPGRPAPRRRGTGRASGGPSAAARARPPPRRPAAAPRAGRTAPRRAGSCSPAPRSDGRPARKSVGPLGRGAVLAAAAELERLALVPLLQPHAGQHVASRRTPRPAPSRPGRCWRTASRASTGSCRSCRSTRPRDTLGMTYPPAHMQNVNRSWPPWATSE